MATLFKAHLHEVNDESVTFPACPQPNIDRKAFRKRMFKRFEKTFADLAK
jgi:hypothetical protein